MNDVRAFFDAEADRYDRAYDDPGRGGRILRKRLADTVALLGDGPGDILDVGMGGGRLCAELLGLGWTVWGVDISPVMVEAARRRLPEIADRLSEGSIAALPFPDDRFDAVTATGVLEYATDDLSRAVRELSRVLRPDGAAVVSFPNHAAPRYLWRGRILYPAVRAVKRLVPYGRPAPRAVPRSSVSALERALLAAGLCIDERRPTNWSRHVAPQVVLATRKHVV